MLEKTTLRSHLKLSVVSIPCFKEACFFPVLKQLKYWPDQPIKIKVERQKREKKKKKGVLSKYPENKYLHKETMTMSKHSIGQV